MLKRLIAAIAAIVGGMIVGRPVSGRWLAHFFIGAGKPKRLPRNLEKQLAWVWHEQVGWDRVSQKRRPCAEMEYLSAHARINGFILTTNHYTDLYTTVGALIMWAEGDRVHYLDVYNWQPGGGWSFETKVFGISIVFKSDDVVWDAIGGEPFITQGSFPTTLDPVKPPQRGVWSDGTSSNLVEVMDVLRRLGVLSEDDIARGYDSRWATTSSSVTPLKPGRGLYRNGDCEPARGEPDEDDDNEEMLW